MDMSPECQVYEAHALRTKKSRTPFPICEHDLAMYIRYRGRNSTFCNHLRNLDQHPLHGKKWLKQMQNSHKVREELRKFLRAWNIPKKDYPSLIKRADRSQPDTNDYLASLPLSVQRKIAAKSNLSGGAITVSNTQPGTTNSAQYNKPIDNYTARMEERNQPKYYPAYQKPSKVVYHKFNEEDMAACDEPIDLHMDDDPYGFNQQIQEDYIESSQHVVPTNIEPERSEDGLYVLIETLDPTRQADNRTLNTITRMSDSEEERRKYALNKMKGPLEGRFDNKEEVYVGTEYFEEYNDEDFEYKGQELNRFENNMDSGTVDSRPNLRWIHRDETEEEEEEEEEEVNDEDYDEDMDIYKKSLNVKKRDEEALRLLGYVLEETPLYVLSHVAIEKSFR